jgi:hypothetical protein
MIASRQPKNGWRDVVVPTNSIIECRSAPGPDADRRHKSLIPNGTRGSEFTLNSTSPRDNRPGVLRGC